MAFIDLTRDDHAYFFGFFQTDGHLSAQSRNRGKATIELSSVDAPILEAFSALFPGLTSFITERTRSTNFVANHTATTWRVHNRAFATNLSSSASRSAANPPTSPRRPYRSTKCGYLRGLVDGDGSVGFTATGRPFVSFVSASAALSDYFCDRVLTVTGVRRTVRPNARDGVYAPMIVSDPAAIMAAWLYPDGCLALERKKAAAAAVAAWVRPAGMRARPVNRRPWTPGEDELVQTTSVREAARRIDRTESAVAMRRWRLKQAGGPAGRPESDPR